MASLWGLAYGDDTVIPISVAAARVAIVGKLLFVHYSNRKVYTDTSIRISPPFS